MHVHIIGICGKLMSGVAIIAKQLGHQVSGCDKSLDNAIGDQLRAHDIPLYQDYVVDHLKLNADCWVIGNTMSRGNELVEEILNRKLTYYSGASWLAEFVMKQRWVLAVSGTHGKTTTTSMMAWIFEYAGLNPGYLVGGNPHNFNGESARATDTEFFIIEADEYDSAFFDKRPKFLHYLPRTLIFNNLEFDHADIYKDLEAIKTQFHFLMRTLPGNGRVVFPADDANVQDVLSRGCWSEQASIGAQNADWSFANMVPDVSSFDVLYQGKKIANLSWELVGMHNAYNALAAIAAAEHTGVKPELAIEALSQFKGVARRLEFKGEYNGIKVYDDFAHHPTAIRTTLAGFRARIGKQKLLAVVEFSSYTMRTGVHQNTLPQVFSDADHVFMLEPANADWSLAELSAQVKESRVYQDLSKMAQELKAQASAGDHVLVMSNGNSAAICEALKQQLSK